MMTPPLKICKSKPQPPPRMLTYATTKASFWAILSLNKQDTHLASFGFHLLMVGIGKGKQSLNVCQCLVWLIKGTGFWPNHNKSQLITAISPPIDITTHNN